MDLPKYVNWLVEEEGTINNCDNKLKCYRLAWNHNDAILDEWALHIRRHYIPDDELIEDSTILNMSVEEFLKKMIIPQKDDHIGPTARANVISEIIFSDLLQFVFNYNVPRCRQYNMSGKTVSEHGTDIIGYKFYNEDKVPNNKDELITMEVKAVLSKSDTSVIYEAVEDSKKDEFRYALSLNWMRKKLKDMNKIEESNDIKRFQLKTQEYKDYTLKHMAGGITNLSDLLRVEKEGIQINVVPYVDGNDLKIEKGTDIFFIHGIDLMKLTHDVFERCKK